MAQQPDKNRARSRSSLAGDVTGLLRLWSGGDQEARERLAVAMYPELKRIAEQKMRLERKDHTLQPSALISEFFLQLATYEGIIWNSRGHFLAVASQTMRRVLIDHARTRLTGKRGKGALVLQLDGLNLSDPSNYTGILEFNDLLDRLAAQDSRMATVVEMRCFGGLTHQEIADAIGVDERTSKRDWQVARAWLIGQLKKGGRDVPRGMGTG
jgi:RNA polymerase sigma-70 factor (ECF subfamily)